MDINILDHINQIDALLWNRMAGNENPFVRHEFLNALEKHQCLGPQFGWLPRHLLISENKLCVAVVPMYIKNNSYGEFVFDWAWADAYERSGHHYYPKLVTSIPYTPATGPRILMQDKSREVEVVENVIAFLYDYAESLGASSLHLLFTTAKQSELLEEKGLLRRTGVQFHWYNNQFRDFDDYLSTFNAHKRKKLKRERRRVYEAGIEFELISGGAISDHQWRIYHQFYESTFLNKGGIPTLSLDFFKALGKTMPDNVLLVLAKKSGEYIAAAFNIVGQTTLYGRHWGCLDNHHSLHFEACFYQGIEYCIAHGLSRFEPGAQGEHKISRGFAPTATYSLHWLRHPGLRRAVADFLTQETKGIVHYIDSLQEHLPFKHTSNPYPGPLITSK